jgi:hypothetical protein
MESQHLMSRVLGWVKVSGWAIVLGLATSALVHQTDGQGAGVMLAGACAILMWRIVVTIGLPELTRDAPQGVPTVQPSALDQQTLSRSA